MTRIAFRGRWRPDRHGLVGPFRREVRPDRLRNRQRRFSMPKRRAVLMTRAGDFAAIGDQNSLEHCRDGPPRARRLAFAAEQRKCQQPLIPPKFGFSFAKTAGWRRRAPGTGAWRRRHSPTLPPKPGGQARSDRLTKLYEASRLAAGSGRDWRSMPEHRRRRQTSVARWPTVPSANSPNPVPARSRPSQPDHNRRPFDRRKQRTQTSTGRWLGTRGH